MCLSAFAARKVTFAVDRTQEKADTLLQGGNGQTKRFATVGQGRIVRALRQIVNRPFNCGQGGEARLTRFLA
jgi:hypothetical protein